MKQITHSQKFIRERKMLMIMPLIVIPFLTLAFWALGGGQPKNSSALTKKSGLNTQLPEAKLPDDRNMNKLSFYDQAQKDSIKLEEQLKSDPYTNADTVIASQHAGISQLQIMGEANAKKFNQTLNPSPFETQPVSKDQLLLQKLSLLEKQINEPDAEQNTVNSTGYPDISDRNIDQKQMEDVLRTGSNMEQDEDPQLKQLSGMMDKILDIQHPDRLRNKIAEESLKYKKQVFSVSVNEKMEDRSILNTAYFKTVTRQNRNKFYNDLEVSDYNANDNSVLAVIHQTQTVSTGSTMKLRLLSDIYVNGLLIQKGNFIFGTATISNERLFIRIPGIRSGNNLLPVSLSVFDVDGLMGLSIPGSITREVAKQSADQSLQAIDLMSMDPSLKAQAISAGIQSAKGLLSKKMKVIKVTIKAGYHVFLKDDNKDEN